jgi:hypothetical protein
MSDIKIITQQQLDVFLKIVAEESLVKSKKVLKESKDDRLSSFSKKLKADEKRYGNLVAEVEEEQNPEQVEVETEEDLGGAEEPISAYKDIETVSFDRVKDAINRVRSGRSLKDKAIKNSLQVYFEKLDEEERIVFYMFLEELSKIITGAISGKDAQDPGDDPLNIDFVTPDEKADSDAKAAVDVDNQNEKPAEDTTPPEDETPIAVNESQDKILLRKKVKELMSLK